MTTKCMKDSIVGDNWIYEACQMNPVTHMGGSTFLTGPVRICYPQLAEAKRYKNKDGTEGRPTFGASLLFPPCANYALMEAEMVRLAAANDPKSYVGGRLFSFPIPTTDQGHRGNQEGYTEGLRYFNVTSDKRPMVLGYPPVQAHIDPLAIKPGFWVIASVEFYIPKSYKRVAASLNGVTLYGEDKVLGGGGGPSESEVRNQMSGIRAATPISVPASAMTAPPVGYPAPQPATPSDEDLMRMLLA